MARLHDIAVRRSDLLHIDPRKIEITKGYNVLGRDFDSERDEDDRALKESIREFGVREPITLRLDGDVPYVVKGHRRISAVKELIEEGVDTIKTVPALPELRGTNQEDRDLDLLTSNMAKLLKPIQTAEVYKRLLGHGWDVEQISKRTGRPIVRINELLDLIGADREIREMVEQGDVAASVAVKAMKKSGKRAKEVLAKAKDVAKASGSKKVSARAIKQVEAEEADPNVPKLNHRGKRQISKHELTKCLRSILECDNIDAAHALARHTLGIKKTSMDPMENAEILREFGIGAINPTNSAEVIKREPAQLGDW